MRAGLFALVLIACLQGCGYGAATCAVVDLAKTACDVLPIRYLDDQGKEQVAHVPKDELRATAMRAQRKDGAP